MAAPKRITPEIGAAIDRLTVGGIGSKSALLRSLEAQGHRLNWRTLSAYLAAGPGVTAAPRPAPTPAHMNPPEVPGALEAAAALALDQDDLATLDASARAVRAALAKWSESIGYDPTAARTYATLARLQADLVARLVELRPRPEAEFDRLAALGLAARARLVEQARAAARVDEDLRGKVSRQEALINSLIDAGPE